MDIFSPEKGKFLVAELALTGDVSFSRSIIFLAEHNEEGSVGFIINKTTDFKLSDLIPEIKSDFDIFEGGPVEQDNLYFLHNIPECLPGSTEITDGIFWGGDFNVLEKELKKGNIPQGRIKFFLGYSGWMPHQLNDEIDENTWIVCENQQNIFQIDEERWKNQIKQLGGEYLIWANSPENPSHN